MEMQDLIPSLESGAEFEFTIQDVRITFIPVKRCPASTKDQWGDHRTCLGIWYSYGSRRGATMAYRFCPKDPHGREALTAHLWQSIMSSVDYAREGQARLDEAAAKHRRIDAALILLDTCERIDDMRDGDSLVYLDFIKAAITEAKESL